MNRKLLVFGALLIILIAGAAILVTGKIDLLDLSAASSRAKLSDTKQTDFSELMLLQSKIKNSLLKGNTKSIIADLVLRKEKFKKIISDNPRKLDLVALDRSSFPQLGKDALDNIEEDATLSGVITAMHYDYLQNPENDKMVYTYTSAGTKYEFYPLDKDKVIVNEPVMVTGKKIDQVFVGTIIKKDNSATARGAIPPPVSGPGGGLSLIHHNVAVFLINHPSSTPDPFTPAQVEDNIEGRAVLIHQSNGNIGAYYTEQSYGNVRFLAQTYGWYTFPDNFLNPCSVNINDIENYLSLNNIPFDIRAFDHVVVVDNCGAGGGAGGNSSIGKYPFFQMLGNVGSASYEYIYGSGTVLSTIFSSFLGSHPFTWTNFDYLFAHEIGHGLGNLHSHGNDCDTATIDPPCSKYEYGNYFDVMGQNIYSLHLNAFYKELRGWIDPANILTITQSGSYVISSLEERPTNQNQKLEAKIMIPGFPDKYYQVEHRRAYGFDAKLTDPALVANTEGLFLSKIINNQQYLLDAQPTTAGWPIDLEQVVIPASNSHGNGPSFSDPRAGLTIGPIVGSILHPVGGPQSVRFSVTYQPVSCIHQAPLISLIDIPKAYANQYSYVNTNFINYDYYICPPSDFLTTTTLPNGFTPQTSQSSLFGVFPDNEYAWGGVSYFVDPSVLPGSYPASVTVTNVTSGLSTMQNFNIEVFP